MRRIFAALAALFLLAAPVAAQQNLILQSGTVTPGHAPYWITDGVQGDAGAAQSSNLSSIGTTGPGSTICANSGPVSGPYNQLCLGANLNSAAQIILQNFGGAPAQQLQVVVNGTTFTVPFGGSGGTPGGATTQLQYNNAGVFGGVAGAVSNGTTIQFTNNDLILGGSSTGTTTFASANTGATNFTVTFPAATANLLYQSGAFVNGQCLQASGTVGAVTVTGAPCGGSGSAPGGSNTQLQYNNSATFGGISGVTSNGTTVTFGNSDLILAGSSTGVTTFTSANASASNFTVTFPAATANLLYQSGAFVSGQCLQSTGTVGAVIVTGSPCGGTPGGSTTQLQYNNAAAFGGIAGAVSNGTTITFANNDLILGGSSTGTTTFASANAGASNFTVTFPAATANLIYQSGAFVTGHCVQTSGTVGALVDTGSACGGSGSVPGGSNTQLQYNNSAAFGGISGATSNGTTITFANNDLILGGSSTGTTTFSSANAGASNFTITVPAVTDTLATLAANQTFTGTITFSNSPTAPTVANFVSDRSTKVATTAYVQNAIDYAMATVNISNITGGTYSFASLGSGGTLTLTTSGGVITSASVTAGGSNYAVGDLIQVLGGNNDALLRVATVSGTALSTVTISYGGTGYSNGSSGATSAANAIPFTFTLLGTLTSNVTFILPNGTIAQNSGQWLFNNNTTGAFTTKVFISNGADATTGTGVLIPQGTANNQATSIESDGVTDVWYASNVFGVGTGTTLSLGGAAIGSNTLAVTGTSLLNGATTILNTLTLGAVSTSTGTLVLDNSASAFTTTIQAGNAAASRTYTWPTNFGASGSILTDAAGNGTLSWIAPPVLSVSNSDGTLTISPTTGAVVASLALGHSNTWTAAQTITPTLTLGVGSSTTGQLILLNATNNTATRIQAGAAANARTYTWPTDFGVSGSVLTDATGNGTLSWTNTVAASLQVGSSAITGGTTTRILYDNAGILGEYTLTGTGTVVVMQTSPTLITPALGVATGTSLALGGATLGTNTFAVTGASLFGGSIISTVRSSAAATVTVSATTDYFLCLDPTSNAIAVNLPATPATGLTYLVKDCTGKAATHSITVTPNSGNIDGIATFVMSTNFQSAAVTYTGAQWSVN
jgi:hypothetical protein